MADDTLELGGGCLCGAVRFTAAGPALWVAHCHCASCRKATASAMATYAGFPRERVDFTKGTPASYGSSPGVTRGFCAHCGTPLSYESARWPGEIHLFLCTFDDPGALSPQAHVFVEEQLAWLHLDDGLPRYPTTSADGPPLD
ncbi:MAG: GFA family protein [Rhodospirillales bacterium]|nr:GFA family protein [Rhodospirillales bacterium]MDH3914020.1 GFA family protein [Rhodospirillales bacterium]MDH3968692.1 GFA family protein [Rhodospirillales bacterium]